MSNMIMRINYRSLYIPGLISGFLFMSGALVSQEQIPNPQLCIIDNIYLLESQKDPKCHATASRLESFMYGTPLTDGAREMRIELQKKLVLFIWDKATKIARTLEVDTINKAILETVFQQLGEFGRNSNGQWYIQNNQEKILIEANDLRQYSSVAYALRAMLSVEQDFRNNPSWNLLPMDDQVINGIKLYIDIATLAALKLSDKQARIQNEYTVDDVKLQKAWNEVLNGSKQTIFITASYPDIIIQSEGEKDYATIQSIINQKIQSYRAYNQISLPILLRNIQVYFARHKWPKEQEASDELKSYLIESLVVFCKDLLNYSNDLSLSKGESFIRYSHINKIVPAYMPYELNDFEDVIYFPGSQNSITIESYDLDAFRDSGLHWLIFDYALNGLKDKKINEPDPFAAELLVESVAQMALLVLRLTGEHSIANGHEHIKIEDMYEAFSEIQNRIQTYTVETESLEPLSTNKSGKKRDNQQLVFFDHTAKIGIDFMHKSSDWLNRLIRSYVVLEDENLIRMAIPPAFGGSGVAAEDINNDGWTDIILLGGMGLKVYLNTGKGGFEDITADSGISLWNESKKSFAETRQIVISDFDNDGLQDLFVSLVDDQHKIYKNINGLVFRDLSDKAKLGGFGAVGGPATVFDFDKDGLLDIYIAYFGNYIEGQLPSLGRYNQNGAPNKLFKNKGDFKFEEVEHMYEDDIDLGWSQAVGHTDINQDGWQDIVVGNDFGVNAYYINQQNGYFKNLNKQLKTDKPSYTMNVASTDLNDDLFPDLYISNIVVMEKDEKYVNPSGETKMNFELEKMKNIRTVEANDLFLSQVDETNGVVYEKSNRVGRGYSSTGWSWDADFFDFDNDGDDDIYCLNGMNDFKVYGSENPYYAAEDGNNVDVLYAHSNKEQNNLFVNEGGYFSDQSSTLGGNLLSNSRSAAYLDYDNDGDLDIIVNNYHDTAVFLENTIDNDNNWIKIKLIGSEEDRISRDAIGSNIIVGLGDNGKKIWREVKSTTGYLSVHPKYQHFGLADENVVDIKVKWPNGDVQNYEGIKANNMYTIDYNHGIQIQSVH